MMSSSPSKLVLSNSLSYKPMLRAATAAVYCSNIPTSKTTHMAYISNSSLTQYRLMTVSVPYSSIAHCLLPTTGKH